MVDKLPGNSSSPPAASAEGGREDQDQDLLRPPQRPVECPLLLRRGAQPQGSSAGGTDGARGRSLGGGGASRSSALLRFSTLLSPMRPSASYPACRCPTPCSRMSPTSRTSSTPATSGTTSCRGRPRPHSPGPRPLSHCTNPAVSSLSHLQVPWQRRPRDVLQDHPETPGGEFKVEPPEPPELPTHNPGKPPGAPGLRSECWFQGPQPISFSNPRPPLPSSLCSSSLLLPLCSNISVCLHLYNTSNLWQPHHCLLQPPQQLQQHPVPVLVLVLVPPLICCGNPEHLLLKF